MIFSFTCFTWLLASLFSHMYVTLSGVMCESEIGLHEIAVFLLGLTRHSLQKYISYKKGRKSKGFHFSNTSYNTDYDSTIHKFWSKMQKFVILAFSSVIYFV